MEVRTFSELQSRKCPLVRRNKKYRIYAEGSCAEMFCDNCGREMHGEEKFCPDCGAPTVVNEQSVATQPQQEAQNNVPMQPYASNFPQGAVNQSGQQVRTAGNNKKLYYGLGIVAGLIILVAVAFVADYFLWQRQMEKTQQNSVVNMTEAEMKAQGMILREKYEKKEQTQEQQSSEGVKPSAENRPSTKK